MPQCTQLCKIIVQTRLPESSAKVLDTIVVRYRNDAHRSVHEVSSWDIINLPEPPCIPTRCAPSMMPASQSANYTQPCCALLCAAIHCDVLPDAALHRPVVRYAAVLVYPPNTHQIPTQYPLCARTLSRTLSRTHRRPRTHAHFHTPLSISVPSSSAQEPRSALACARSQPGLRDIDLVLVIGPDLTQQISFVHAVLRLLLVRRARIPS